MARSQEAEVFDYNQAPKGREKFANSYMNVEVTVAEKRHGDDGAAYFWLEGVVTGPHADGTEDYDGHPVFIRWQMGTEDDPEATDPTTWMPLDKKGLDEKARKRAVGHDMGVENLISCLKAAKLTKGEGKGVAPWVLFADLEGETICVQFGERNEYQTYKFFELGAREPMVVGHRASRTAKREPEAPPARKARDPEPEVDTQDEPEPPRRVRR